MASEHREKLDAASGTDAGSAESRAVRARAVARITMRPETLAMVLAHEVKKGDVLGASRFAGVQAAKDAASFLPLVDLEPVTRISVDFQAAPDGFDVTASVEGPSQIGVPMRALSAATVAALTIYDMCKSADRTMEIGPVELHPGA